MFFCRLASIWPCCYGRGAGVGLRSYKLQHTHSHSDVHSVAKSYLIRWATLLQIAVWAAALPVCTISLSLHHRRRFKLGDLDDAVLDRMDEALEFGLPGPAQRAQLLKLYLDR